MISSSIAEKAEEDNGKISVSKMTADINKEVDEQVAAWISDEKFTSALQAFLKSKDNGWHKQLPNDIESLIGMVDGQPAKSLELLCKQSDV